MARGSDAPSGLYHPSFPERWSRTALYGLARWHNGLAFRNIDFTPTGDPVIKIAEIKNGITAQTKFTSAYYDKRFRVLRGDLLFSWSGQPDSSIDAFWWRRPEGWLNQHIFKVEPNDGVDRVFFFYLLRYLKPLFVEIARNKQTTGLGHVTRRDLEAMQVGLPTIDEQRLLARTLGPIDDKIELNIRVNQTLEAMAQALFKSWFVDFDPVRAKAEGHQPWGINAKTAALFPHGFAGANGRELPGGWHIWSLGDAAGYLSRGIGPAYIEEGGVLVLNQKCIRGGRVDFSKGRRHDISRRTVEGRELRPGDVLVNSTGVGTLGRVAQVDYLPEPTVIVDSHVTVVRANEQVLHPLVLGLDLGTREGEIEALGEGSTGQTELSRDRLRALAVLVPPRPVQDVFVSAVEPMRQRMALNERQSLTLAAIRDLLLPRLLSGELCVKDAETAVAATI